MKPIRSFTVPALPMSRNKRDRAHWAKRKREMDEWLLETPLAHGKYLPEGKRRVVITFYEVQLSDPADNLPSRAKTPIDALVRRGWLIDDSGQFVEAEIKQVKVGKRAEQRTEIEVFKVAEAKAA